MTTNYPAPPWESQQINPQQSAPQHSYVRPDAGHEQHHNRMNFEQMNIPDPLYQPIYMLPSNFISGYSFNQIKESRNSCLKLEAETYNLVTTDNIDRLYYGTVNGEVVCLPFNSAVVPAKACLKPVTLKSQQDPDPTVIYEVQGLKLDYANRVWVCNAAGLFCFSPGLDKNLFFMPDDRPANERIDNYLEDLRRLETDYNKRYIYWLLAGCILRVLDTSTCAAVGPDFQFNRASGLTVRQWRVSPDGQVLYVLYDNLDGHLDKFEAYSIPQAKALPGFQVQLNPREFKGDTRYYSFAVDFNHGKVAIIGLSPDLQSYIEEDEDGNEEYVEDDLHPKDRDLIIRTYQLTNVGMTLLGVQQINQLEKNFFPYMINDCQFSDLEDDNGSGAGTLFLSVLGGLRKQKNYLFLVRWNAQQLSWFRHLVIYRHHKDQQISWQLKRNLLITAGADETLSINSFS